ncbi:hypothetical protein KKC1_33010 [Calderihabitans maritimus]|uniref:Uncharacterized protein n=1 Tax=Calderihabitans maritimus TaxID=1246530 RepID=A0A1Z5HXP4_9FIRM|nr:hypothetical protein KKC1_33010 [Calderihabitans maritimus]
MLPELPTDILLSSGLKIKPSLCNVFGWVVTCRVNFVA